MAIAIFRTVILFGAIIISLRIMGKRQLGELEPAELVAAVLISNLASHPLQDLGTPLIYGLVPVLTILCCEVLLSAGIMKSLRFRAVLCGKPSIVITNGKIDQREMRKNRFTIDELMVELRKNGILDVSTIKTGVLEADGTMSIILFSEESAVTPKQMALSVPDMEYPVIIINDGRLLEQNLKILGFNEKWLQNQLKSRNIKSEKDVYLLSSNKNGEIYYAVKERAS
jgi:uncharacterized membrane protein YcaP (DUF421 family)